MSISIPYAKVNIGSVPRGKNIPVLSGLVLGALRLPTDPIGTTTVTFLNVHANSEIRVYREGGIEMAGVENCISNHQLTWDVFSLGSTNNNVTIKIIHDLYEIITFNYVSTLANVGIPIQQREDKWFSNP